MAAGSVSVVDQLPALPFPLHTEQRLEIQGLPIVGDDVYMETRPLGKLKKVPQGYQVQFEGNVWASREGARMRHLVRSVTTGLYRTSTTSMVSPDDIAERRTRDECAGYSPAAVRAMASAGTISSDVGRSLRFASASGDWNPVHLSDWAAGFIGMKGPLAHGMWTLAAAVDALEERGVLPGVDADTGTAPSPFFFDVYWRKPVILPATAEVRCPDRASLPQGSPKAGGVKDFPFAVVLNDGAGGGDGGASYAAPTKGEESASGGESSSTAIESAEDRALRRRVAMVGNVGRMAAWEDREPVVRLGGGGDEGTEEVAGEESESDEDAADGAAEGGQGGGSSAPPLTEGQRAALAELLAQSLLKRATEQREKAKGGSGGGEVAPTMRGATAGEEGRGAPGTGKPHED